MKFTAGLLTEITNVLIIIQSGTIEDVIKDFIAFGFICEIDNLMISTVTSINCSEDIGNAGVAYPKKQSLQSLRYQLAKIWLTKSDNLSFGWKINNSIQTLIKFVFYSFYKIIYYYFLPSTVILFVFFM